MSESTKAVLFNAVPLLALAAAYAAVSAALLPVLWRDRARAHPLDWAIAAVFPGVAAAAAILGVLVLHDRRPLGGHLWASFAASLAALLPALLLLARWRDRAFVVGGIGRTLEVEERLVHRDSELEAVTEISNALGRARDILEVARPVVRHVTSLFAVGFAGVVLVDESRERATGVYGEVDGASADWWAELDLDLQSPSGIASAVFDAAPVSVFDISSSPLVSRPVADRVGAESGCWIPMIAEERVLGVLSVASTDAKRAFTAQELSLLQAIAWEAALALERLRSASALNDALGREQAIGEIARRVRTEHDPEGIVRVAREELRRVLRADDIGVTIAEDIATVRVWRAGALVPSEEALVGTVEHEVSTALRTARLLAENRRRIEQQGALLQAAQVVTSELDIETVLRRLVEEVTKLLGADAADCYLLDEERGVLRCAAVHGFDASLLGFEYTPTQGVAAAALREERSLSSDEYLSLAAPIPNPAYEGFHRALVAPMVWEGKTRGVLGIGLRSDDRSFDQTDADSAGGVRVARIARVAERRELCRANAAGARAARLLPDRVAAR